LSLPGLHQHLDQGTPVHGLEAVEQLDNIIIVHYGTRVLFQIIGDRHPGSDFPSVEAAAVS